MNRSQFIGSTCAVGSVLAWPGICSAKIERGIYYTRVNIWYDHPSKIYSTNYHSGTILPAGTKVQVIAVNSSRIRFHEVETGKEFYITHIPKHSILTIQQFLSRCFSPENVFAKKEFTEEERRNIEAGTINVGMRKKAVLAAYGYPPSHKTNDLYGEEWIYWVSRSQTRTVVFADETVASIH